ATEPSPIAAEPEVAESITRDAVSPEPAADAAVSEPVAAEPETSGPEATEAQPEAVETKAIQPQAEPLAVHAEDITQARDEAPAVTNGAAGPASRSVAPTRELDTMLAAAGMQMIETRAPAEPYVPPAPVRLGRARKPVAVVQEEQLEQVETH